ncbi:class I SAM-dependent methyltransferase [Saccharopolyspora mangrovi]|uniref:Class I SAM-dependent methyltransferase n=1 Tax=Saccharopolyspora mangrovi TaxID=3082379 RepID=A0ABU6A9M6_9PSEU|nr:class I SAM-dependent methyltransferase [Saccharopolyspora sp. S2-29]MEB3368210.1 class I SAM-dependent methyltransferase [Saccharopolyspora sp. S2-29]
MNDPERSRSVFAERYDRCRPSYPAQLFDLLTATVGEGARVLEIGCGTGQASVPLAARGFALTALEPEEEFAEIARRRLAGYLSVRVVVEAFEDWRLPPVGFDLVVAAASFHRLDPELRMVKAADALRPRAALAVVSTHHVAGGSGEFFGRVQQCYERFAPGAGPGQRLPVADEIPQDPKEFHRSARFSPPEFHCYEWEARYTSEQYRDLLMTYSGHRAIPAHVREELLDCIGRRIDDDHGGVIAKRYLTQLALAQRLG